MVDDHGQGRRREAVNRRMRVLVLMWIRGVSSPSLAPLRNKREHVSGLNETRFYFVSVCTRNDLSVIC